MLGSWEQEARAIIRKSEAPFLGLLGYALPSGTAEAIRLAIAVDPTVPGYIRLLYRYPALFAIHLTTKVMEGMGQTGNFDLYRHVYAALQLTTTASVDEKEGLWSSFRSVVTRLGLEVSPRQTGHHFMADTYLRQVGVPLAFADDLAERMLDFAKSAGLPDVDDPEGIARWQTALVGNLNPPFSKVAREAVAVDTLGYYTRTFINVHLAGGALVSANPLEQAMARAFEHQPSGHRFRRSSLAHLALRSGDLGVFLHAGEVGRTVQIVVGGRVRQLWVGTDDEFFSLQGELPDSVVVRDPLVNQAQQFEVWSDQKSNRLLIFTDAGRFKAQAQLGMTEPLVLSPGRYTALSRFSPEAIDVTEVSSSPRLYHFDLDLHPGDARVLSNGPVSLTLQGEDRPMASWVGPVRGTRELLDVFYGSAGLKLEFPPKWVASSPNFAVALTTGIGGASALIGVTADQFGLASITLSEVVWNPPLKPGLSRILAEVRRADEARPIIRTATLFWSGLKSVSAGLKFHLAESPANLMRNDCRNFELSTTLIQPKDKVSRQLSLCFQLDAQRVQSLSWNAPGTFVEVTGVRRTGARFQLARALGSTEAVSLTSNKMIIVSSSESGDLALGEWAQFTDFARCTSVSLPAAFLASRAQGHANTLTFRPLGAEVGLPLLQLVQPHYLDGVTDKVVDGQLVITLNSPNELEAIRVFAVEMLAGERIEVELLANRPDWTQSAIGRARLMVIHSASGGFVASLYLALDAIDQGAWIIQFDGMINGKWGHLQNLRNDQFAIGLIRDRNGAVAGVGLISARLAALSDAETLPVFMRLQQALLPCYAEQAWDSIKWLGAGWRLLLERWRQREAEGVTTLVEMACCRPPEDANPSWIPQLHIGADLPGLFAVAAVHYRKVNEGRHPLARALRAIAQVEKSFPSVFGSLLHLSAAMGFANFPAIARGAVARDFSIAAYAQGLQQTDGDPSDLVRLEVPGFVPEPGDYLGPVHFRYAMAALDRAYENSLDGNEIRRGQAIGLCRHVRMVMPVLDDAVVKSCRGADPRIHAWLRIDEAGRSDEQAQRQENLDNVVHFLSLFALRCRADAREPGLLPDFISGLYTTGIPVESSLSYLLQIGDAAFAYYLLMWEVAISGENNSKRP